MGQFLDRFVAAGLQGELREVLAKGPPWRLQAAVRLDDHAVDESGRRVYENRVVLYVTTRWGKVVRQEDFFADTGRIEAFDRYLARREGDTA